MYTIQGLYLIFTESISESIYNPIIIHNTWQLHPWYYTLYPICSTAYITYYYYLHTTLCTILIYICIHTLYIHTPLYILHTVYTTGGTHPWYDIFIPIHTYSYLSIPTFYKTVYPPMSKLYTHSRHPPLVCVLRAPPIPKVLRPPDSPSCPTSESTCNPTPPMIQKAFEKLNPPTARGRQVQ
jgi:hypothetical protein